MTETVDKPSEQLVLQWNDKNFALRNAYLKIGRTTANDIKCDDPLVSSRHCIISNGVLIDSKSTNGSLINDNKVQYNQKYELAAGDKLTVGAQIMHIRRASEVFSSSAEEAVLTTIIPIPPDIKELNELIEDAQQEKNDGLDKTVVLASPIETAVSSIPHHELVPTSSNVPNFLNSTHNFTKRQKKGIQKKRTEQAMRAGIDRDFMQQYLNRIEALESQIEGLTYQLLYAGRDERAWIKQIEEEAIRKYTSTLALPSIDDIQNKDAITNKVNSIDNGASKTVLIDTNEDDSPYANSLVHNIIVEQSAIDELKIQHAEEIAELNEEIASLHDEVVKLESVIETDADTIKKLHKENDDFLFAKRKAETLGMDLQKSKEETESSFYETQSKLRLLGKDHEEKTLLYQQKVKALSIKLSEAKDETENVKRLLAEEKNKAVVTLNKQYKNSTNVMDELKSQIENLRMEATNSQTALSEKNIEIKNLRKSVEELSAKAMPAQILVHTGMQTEKIKEEVPQGVELPKVSEPVEPETPLSPESDSWSRTFLKGKIHMLEMNNEQLQRTNRMAELELQRRIHELETLRTRLPDYKTNFGLHNMSNEHKNSMDSLFPRPSSAKNVRKAVMQYNPAYYDEAPRHKKQLSDPMISNLPSFASNDNKHNWAEHNSTSFLLRKNNLASNGYESDKRVHPPSSKHKSSKQTSNRRRVEQDMYSALTPRTDRDKKKSFVSASAQKVGRHQPRQYVEPPVPMRLGNLGMNVKALRVAVTPRAYV